jgi:pyrroloquinoline quinone biosynthesis protein E
LALLAELTHRCPLRCPYCSNPLALERARTELDTETWQRVLDEAAALGVLQVHFSGGEPLARRDLATLVGHATKAGLYGNLITSGIGLDAARMAAPTRLEATILPASRARRRKSVKPLAWSSRPVCR